MDMVRAQYEELVAKGAYDRESEAWPEYQVNEGELDYLADWLERRFAYLDVELNESCGTWEEEELTENQFVEVFPNPASDRINLRFGEAFEGEAVVALYDMTGRMVFDTKSSAQALCLSTVGLPDGLYTLVIQKDAARQVSRILLTSVF